MIPEKISGRCTKKFLKCFWRTSGGNFKKNPVRFSEKYSGRISEKKNPLRIAEQNPKRFRKKILKLSLKLIRKYL